MALKRDDSFLQYLTMGAVGSARVAADLNARGHRILELERYTTSNKIWTTKVKRLRLPDLLCLRCGLRVEARAKTKLEIKLSDSPTVAGREWDAGIGDEDLVAIVHVSWDGTKAIASHSVSYFKVEDLRATVGGSRLGPPKSAAEGAERDRTWPSSSPLYPGRVIEVTGTHIRVSRDGGGERNLSIRPGFVPYLRPGDFFAGGDRISAGLVPQPLSVDCPGDGWDAPARAEDPDAGLRYAAIKALGFVGGSDAATTKLRAVWEDSSEDLRIRLEALGALARRDSNKWIGELGKQALTAESIDMAMEAILILSELPIPGAAEILSDVLAIKELPDELRAAAAWGIGIGGHKQPELILDYLDDPSDDVAIHSLVAAGSDLSHGLLEKVASLITRGPRAAAAAIHLLARNGPSAAEVLVSRADQAEDKGERAWATFGLGLLGREAVELGAGPEVAEHLARELEPLWTGLHENWLTGDRAAAIEFVGRQHVREEALLQPAVPG